MAACSQFRLFAWLVLSLPLVSCRSGVPPQSHKEAITVLMWSAGAQGLSEQIAREFTRNTGVEVKLIPGSESTSARFSQEAAIVRNSKPSVDVVEMDIAWVHQFTGDLADLRPVLGSQLNDQQPAMIANATEDGAVIAAPLFADYPLLYARTDLLRKYGFSHAPRTWTELEQQAAKIQRGERGEGNPRFWGYVWQGADYEGLVADALEWQYSEGGGNFITDDRHANVANAAATAAFARAVRWEGTITPPSVVAYMEEDSRNVWESGNAAFLRNWAYVYPMAKRDSQALPEFEVTPLPAGKAGIAGVVGGWYLGVPKRSPKQRAAAEFVRLFTSRDAELKESRLGYPPTIMSLYQVPELQNSDLYQALWKSSEHAVLRPTAVAGRLYPCISKIYAQGVHDILMKSVKPEAGTRQMQAKLEQALHSPSGVCE